MLYFRFTFKSYLLLFFICSFFSTTLFASTSSKRDVKNSLNTLITFLVSADNSQIVSLHSNPEDKKEGKVLLLHDSVTGTLIKKIPVPLITDYSWFKPSFVATPDGKKIYITDIDKAVYMVDLNTQNVIQLNNKPKQDVGQEVSSGMIITPDGKYVYIGDGVKQQHSPAMLHTIETLTNNVVAATPSDSYGWHQATMTLNIDASLLYISRQTDYSHGEISIFNTRTHYLEDVAINMEGRIEGILINPIDGKLYVNQRRHVSVLDPITHKEIEKIKVANQAYAMTFALNGNKLFLADLNDGSDEAIRVYDIATKQNYSIPIFITKRSEMHTSADGAYVYVSNNLYNKISIIDANQGLVIRELRLNY